MRDKKFTYLQKKDSKFLMDSWWLFWHYIIMKYEKVTNLLDITSDNVPRFITKNG